MSVGQPLICCPVPKEPLHPCHGVKVWFSSCSGGTELCSAPFPPALSFACQQGGGVKGGGVKVLNSPFFTGFCTRHIVQICWVPPASSASKGYQEAATASKGSLSKGPHFRQGFGDASMDFPHRIPVRKGADGWRRSEDGLLSLPSPDKHPSEIILPGASKKHHHRFFSHNFLSGIYP